MLVAGHGCRGLRKERSYSYTDSIREESLERDRHDDELCSIDSQPNRNLQCLARRQDLAVDR